MCTELYFTTLLIKGYTTVRGLFLVAPKNPKIVGVSLFYDDVFTIEEYQLHYWKEQKYYKQRSLTHKVRKTPI